MTGLRVLHTTTSVGPASFGLGPVALNLALEQSALGCDATIWSLDAPGDLRWAAEASGFPLSRMTSFGTCGPRVLRLSLQMEREASRCVCPPGAVAHQHGVFAAISRASHVLRRRRGVPVLITAHGMLERWALERSKWKKRVALTLYERENLRRAACLHACSAQEATGLRDFGLRNPIAVIPNGISASWLESRGDSVSFRLRWGLAPERRIALFLSRITPVKGLLLLLDAVHSLRGRFKDWTLVIAGSDEFGHQAEVEAQIKRLGLADAVLFTGLLSGQAKRDAFAAADVFVLPTRREAAPLVVLEALGAGVPVLTTKGAPWEDLVRWECGWWVDVDSPSLAEALADALASGRERLQAMGARGRRLVAERYAWPRLASKTVDVYAWMLGRRAMPDCVVVD